MSVLRSGRLEAAASNNEHYQNKNRINKAVRSFFTSRETFKQEMYLEEHGFPEKVNYYGGISKVLFFYSLLILTVWIIEKLVSGNIDWSKLFGGLITLGLAVVACQQWIANRQETSIDKYYDRLEGANKRLAEIPDVKPEDMYVFVELDKLEYVIIKYNLGYISPELAKRALENFLSICARRDRFKDRASHHLEEAAYLEKTKRVVRKSLQMHIAPSVTESIK